MSECRYCAFVTNLVRRIVCQTRGLEAGFETHLLVTEVRQVVERKYKSPNREHCDPTEEFRFHDHVLFLEGSFKAHSVVRRRGRRAETLMIHLAFSLP